MRRDLVFSSLRWPGREQVRVRTGDHGASAEGLIVGGPDDPELRIRYRVECNSAWATTAATLDTPTGQVRLRRSGQTWQLDGVLRPDLAGCLDIDIALTPFTNTLPIRRLGLEVGEEAEIAVVYLQPAEHPVEVREMHQRYTRLDEHVYRYQSGAFSRDLEVDSDGIVLTYPGIWELG